MTTTIPTPATLHPGSATTRASGRGRVTPASPALRFVIALAIVCMPILTPTGPGNTSPADVPIVLAIGGILLWLSRNRVRLHVPYALGMWLLMSAGAVAAVSTRTLGSTAALGQDLFLLLWAAALASAVQADRSLVRLVCVSWCWSGVVCAGLLVGGRLAGLSWLAGQTTSDGSRSALRFGDPNLAANYFVACLFLVLASRYPRRRLPRAGAVLLIGSAIVLTGSNGAMLGVVAGLAAGALVGAWRSRGALAAIGLACVLALGGGLLVTSVDWGSLQAKAAAGGPVLHDSFGRGDASSQDRQVLLAEGARLFWEGNVIGLGPGRTKQTLASIPSPYVKEAHNDYMATLVERGAAGGVGLVVLLASIAARLARVAGRRVRTGRSTIGAGVLPSPHFLVAMGVAFLVSGSFYEVLHFRHLWAFLGLLAGLDLVRGRSSESPSADAVPPAPVRRPSLPPAPVRSAESEPPSERG